MVMVKTDRQGNKSNRTRFSLVLAISIALLTVLFNFDWGNDVSLSGWKKRPSRANARPSSMDLRPSRSALVGCEVLWQFPTSIASGTQSSRQMQTCPVTSGVLFLYHGCTRRAASFFYSPQGQVMLRMALGRGMAVVAFSKKIELGCWSEKADLIPVIAAGRAWLEEYIIPWCGKESMETVPVFGFGASSGGSFLALIANSISNDNAFALRAINVQISAPTGLEWSIPTFFTVMSRDSRTMRAARSIAEKLEAKGVSTRTLSTTPKIVTPEFFYERFVEDDGMSKEVSQHVYDELCKMNAIDPGQGNYLLRDPRSLDLGPIFQREKSQAYGLSADLAESLTAEERKDAEELWLVEELNVAFDQHEITAEGFSEVLDFFMHNSNP